MKKRIEQLIPKAIDAVETHLANNKKVDSEYNGYISSFGAAVIQSGLVPAVAFYSSESSKSDKDKKKLLTAIADLMQIEGKLLDFVLQNDFPTTKDWVLDVATSLKLAIRTFELVKSK